MPINNKKSCLRVTFLLQLLEKLSSMNSYLEKEPIDESLSACKYRDL